MKKIFQKTSLACLFVLLLIFSFTDITNVLADGGPPPCIACTLNSGGTGWDCKIVTAGAQACETSGTNCTNKGVCGS